MGLREPLLFHHRHDARRAQITPCSSWVVWFIGFDPSL